jgi:hypothetical protein
LYEIKAFNLQICLLKDFFNDNNNKEERKGAGAFASMAMMFVTVK